MRPDIRHGRVASAPRSATASPLPLPEFRLPPPTGTQLDYSSPFLCRIDLGLLRGHTQPRPASAVPSPSAFLEQLRVDVTGAGDVSSQAHLTKASACVTSVSCPDPPTWVGEGGGGGGLGMRLMSPTPPPPPPQILSNCSPPPVGQCGCG